MEHTKMRGIFDAHLGRWAEGKMMKEFKKMFFVSLLGLMGPSVFASESYKCTKYSLPSFQTGCEGEGCGSIEYFKAIKTVKVYKESSTKSSVIDTLQKCEAIRNFKSFMLISNFGAGKIMEFRDEGLIKASTGTRVPYIHIGDTIPLTHYNGEGYFSACTGKDEFIVGDPGGQGEIIVKVLSKPKVQGWVQLTTPRGRKGYVPESEHFYLHHYNYDKSLVCPEDQ